MLVLHYCSNSRAERVLWLLEELKLQYNLNKIKFHPSELKSEEHRSRHPLGRIPVLEDNNITIYESGAIIEYLIAKHNYFLTSHYNCCSSRTIRLLLS